MNIHPIFVHFPIAFLTLYAVSEFIRSKKVVTLPGWRYIKLLLLVVGLLGAFLALGTGDFGEKEFISARAIIRVHETFAQITTSIFSALVLYYLVFEVNVRWGAQIASTVYMRLWNIIATIFNKVFSKQVIIALAFLGLITISITGALGGAIVYGPNADPVVHLVYSWFF